MDILSSLTSLLGQGGSSSGASQSQGAGGLDSDMLGGLVGALFGGKGTTPPPSSSSGARSGAGADAGLGGLGSLLGSLMGGGGAPAPTSSSAGASGGGLGGLLGSLLGGDAKNVPPPPVKPTAPATAENITINTLRALVYAARADGKVDASEQAAIQDHIKKVGLGSQAQSFIDQTFQEKIDPNLIARNITSADEAMKIYILTCAVTGLNDPREQQYAEDLAGALQIPQQVRQAVRQKLGIR